MHRLAVNEIINGRLSNGGFTLFFKYDFDKSQRENILKRLPAKFQQIVYANPFPEVYEDLCNVEYVFDTNKTLLDEVKWYFDSFLKFSKEINNFLIYNDELEKLVLVNQQHDALVLLDKIDMEISTSLYSLNCEFYINESIENSDENKAIMNHLYKSSSIHKVQLIAEFTRVRVEKNISSWQYDTSVEQHRKLYNANSQQYIDYVTFKLDPVRYDIKLNHLPFIASFESDFSLIDRYFSMKKLLVLIFLSQDFGSIANDIQNYCAQLIAEYNDPFWQKLYLLSGYVEQKLSERAKLYYQIQDLFFLCKYKEVALLCQKMFANHANFSENYLFFVQSLLFLGEEIEEYLSTESDLRDILRLIKNVLEKGSNYYAEREKLLKKYYSISHFDFSNAILEFILNEFNLANPPSVHYSNYLFTVPIRYNFYKEIKNVNTQTSLANSLSKYDTFHYLNKLITTAGSHRQDSAHTFFASKIKVGYLMSLSNYPDALLELESFYYVNTNHLKPDFVDTWYNKNSIKCFVQLKKYDKAADLIVNYFFKKGVAYDHFYDQLLFEKLSESEESETYSNISIPILFQIYNQPSAVIYDAIANFLINNNVFRPSELLQYYKKWNVKEFNFLLEKCFTMENIDDSPFLNTIEILEQERIIILNYLKEVDNENSIKYNEEILKITKEASIRKGLMQIHESRIYVDVSSLSRILKLQYSEMFERYLEFSDASFSQIYSLKLNDDTFVNKITYYFKEPVDEALLPLYDILNDFENDSNAVKVPYVRYIFYETLFEEIKEKFVFDEDYGFKSFLSMRIRHGTFSNVLRNVFDKYNLVSSKEPNSQDYREISFWQLKLSDVNKNAEFQKHLKKFSEEIDFLIDEALAWVKVMSVEAEEISGLFNFLFSQGQLLNIFKNRIGRITSFHDFIEHVFAVLFERLELSLTFLRQRISDKLTPFFLQYLNNLQKNVESIGFEENDFRIIEREILDCSTEIQVVTSQIINWFKISKNQYIEEFPIDLILQTIIDYMNSINQNALNKATLNIRNRCNTRFKGRYFESFGDIFINLFDNIINKNKSLENSLLIDIDIENEENMLRIVFGNNLPDDTNIDVLEQNIKSTLDKIENYQNGSIVSFEQGSGYLKLCKSIAVDLDRKKYSIIPKCEEGKFEVNISFDLDNLTT